MSDLLQLVVSEGASDLHIGAAFEPMLRIQRVLEKTNHRLLTPDETTVLVYALLSDPQIETFDLVLSRHTQPDDRIDDL